MSSILVTYSAHLFTNSILNHIVDLSKDYDIVLGITSDYLTQENIDQIESLIFKGVLLYYFKIENNKGVLRLYRSLLKETGRLKTFNFDIWLTGSNIQIYERYIESFCSSRESKIIIYWDGVTYLMENNAPAIVSNNCNRNSINLIKKVFSVVSSEGVLSFSRKAGLILWNRISLFFSIYIDYYERTLLPLFLFNKTFEYRKYERLTQLTSGNVDAILFTDSIEVEKHKELYETDNIFMVKHSLSGSCNCAKSLKNKSNTILSPLSGIVGENTVSNEFLNEYLGCLKIIFSESSANLVHLRKHPRESGRWPYQLCNFLNKNKIPSIVLESNDSIAEVTCNYLGVAGFASCTLRDARAACDYCFIIGFEELSFVRYTNPKYIFGSSNGIEWLSSKNSYDKNIFEIYKHVDVYRGAEIEKVIDNLPKNGL